MVENFKLHVDNSIWKLFDILREDINTEDYSVLLLFLYLRSENLIYDKIDNEFQLKKTLIEELKKEKNDNLKSVFKAFLPTIEDLNDLTVYKVVKLLVSVDLEWIQQNITVLYDQILERVFLLQGRRGGDFIQPKELTEFVNGFIGSTKGLKVYNPFAGLGSFIKDYQDSDLIYAQELNYKNWAIGQLRLILHHSSAEYRCEDSITNWFNQEKFDLIVSNPPFGIRLNGIYKEQYSFFKNTEEFFVNKGLDSLSPTGKLVAVLPQGVLFRGGAELKLRERLIEKDLLDTIISFPGGILHNTGIPFIILVLNRAKSSPGKIRLVKADDCISKPSSRENIIEVEKLLEVSKRIKNSNSVRIITANNVIENGYNLNVSRYFQEEVEGVKLKEILTHFKGCKQDLPETGKLIRVRDLKDDKFDFYLNSRQLEDVSLRKSIYKIDTSCLFLAAKWGVLKPTYFQFEDVPVFKGLDILQFHVNESKVNVTYLINELHTEYVQQQLDGYKQGSTIPFITKDDLLEVKIKLPSIEEQTAKVAGIKEISEKIKELESERNALVHGIRTEEFKEFASLKHTLGRPRQNILGWSKNLSRFFVREKETISFLNDEFKEMFDLGLVEAITEINRDIKFISDVLEKGENGLVLKDYEKEIIPLAEINNIVNALSNNEFKFLIKKQLLKVDEMKTRGVYINKVLFKTLLDNLLTNANKYGFKEKSKSNHVIIELSDINNSLVIEVKNNGLPFPNNFDRNKFVTKFSTADISSGSGLGGYDINRIAAYFENQDWDLILNSDPVYPVVFRFLLPIKLIK